MVQNDAQEFLDRGSKLHELGSLEEALTYY